MIRKGENLCLLSALSPSYPGPRYFIANNRTYGADIQVEETAAEMAKEIVAILGDGYNVVETKQIAIEALSLSLKGQAGFARWLEDYLGRPYGPDDGYFQNAVLIGSHWDWWHNCAREVQLLRVCDYNREQKRWMKIVHRSVDGVDTHGPLGNPRFSLYGPNLGDPVFCWEKPYRYFEEWMRRSSPELAAWDQHRFAKSFFRVVVSNRTAPRKYFHQSQD
jgi:hypothetical protein